MIMPKYVCLRHQEQHLGDYSIVPLRYEDRFAIMKWRNEQIYHLRQTRPLTEDDQQRYFDNVVSKLYDNPKPDQILFSYLQKGICIGYGGLVHINWIDRNGEISFIMDTQLETEHFAEHWSNYLTMLKAVAFDDLGLHKIYTYAFDLRPHLYTMLEANGYKREATLKEHCLFNGEYKDVVLHSLWNDRYEVINYVDCSKEQNLDILALRNRDDVRSWMVNPEVIPEENHFKFVESLKGNLNRLYYAIYKNGVLVGTYNLTKEEEGIWERGIIANPVNQGKGETEKWEHQILADLPKHGVKALTAKVKLDNPRSIKYHKKLGYLEQARDKEYIYYILRLQ
jgi:RimJ/RimL family protein N-acetyltransferase